MPAVDARRVRHGEPASHGLPAGHIDHAPRRSLDRAPAGGRVGLRVRRDKPRPSLVHGQTVQVATVFRSQRTDKRRPPTRQEVVVVVQCTQAREARVDQPQFVAAPRHLVPVDVLGDMAGAGQVTGVVSPRRFDLGSHAGRAAEKPHLAASADRDPVAMDRDPHGLLEIVKRQRQPVFVRTEHHELARLVGGYQHRDPLLRQNSRELASVFVPHLALVVVRTGGVGRDRCHRLLFSISDRGLAAATKVAWLSEPCRVLRTARRAMGNTAHGSESHGEYCARLGEPCYEA